MDDLVRKLIRLLESDKAHKVELACQLLRHLQCGEFGKVATDLLTINLQIGE